MQSKKRLIYLLVALAVTLACVPVLPSVESLPTQPVGMVDTIVAGTYAAAARSTEQQITPSLTPIDTFTPSPTATITPTATATIIFKTPTKVIIPTSGGGGSSGGGSGGGGSSGGGGGGSSVPKYKCTVISVSPANNTHFAANTNFTTTWRVRNTGYHFWDHNSVDYRYSSGAHLHLQSLYDLPSDVGRRDTIDLSVDMRAPNSNGVYTTTWLLQVGKETFCNMKLTIRVP